MQADGERDAPLVLVVDDDPAMRRFLEVVMLRAGFSVAVAATGREAIAALRGTWGEPAGRPPAAVLLDAMLPDMRGFDLARRLLDDPAMSGVPICFLTGAVYGRTRPRAGVACVVKPSSPTELVAAVRGLIEDADASDAGARREAVDLIEATSLL